MNWFNLCDLFCVMFSTISTYFVGRQFLLVDTSPFEYPYRVGVGHSDTPSLMFLMYLLLLWEIYFLERGDFVLNTTCIMIYVYEMLSVTPSLCINVVFVIYWIKNIFNSHLSISFIVPASINQKKTNKKQA